MVRRMDRKSTKKKAFDAAGSPWSWWSFCGPFWQRYRFFRIDLTSEKKYTLSQSSRQLIEELDDVVYVQIYLDGDLPSEFVNFRKSIRELMDEFRAYGRRETAV